MAKEALEALRSDSFLLLGLLDTTPKAMHGTLQTSETVHSLREAVLKGKVDDNDVVFFVGSLLSELERGCLFPYEMTLIGLAVTMELVPEKWAHEYIAGLAELRIKEMPLAWRVAKICLGDEC